MAQTTSTEATAVMTETHFTQTAQWVDRMERMARYELAMVAYTVRYLPEADPQRIAFHIVTGDMVNRRIAEVIASN